MTDQCSLSAKNFEQNKMSAQVDEARIKEVANTLGLELAAEDMMDGANLGDEMFLLRDQSIDKIRDTLEKDIYIQLLFLITLFF